MDRASRSHLKGLRINNEQQTTVHHHLAQRLTWLQTGEDVRDGNHGGKSSSTTRGNSSQNDLTGVYRCTESLRLPR